MLTFRMNGDAPEKQTPNGLTISFWIKHFLATTSVDVVTNHMPSNNGINIGLSNHDVSARKIDWTTNVRLKKAIWTCNFRGRSALLWTH